MQHHDGILAAGEHQHRAFKLGDDLPNNVDRLAFEYVEFAEPVGTGAGRRGVGGRGLGRDGCGAHWCSPHSVFSSLAQRPERGSAPSATFAVHGAHPIDG